MAKKLNKFPFIRVIVVEPKHPENIGSIARICFNFGISELFFVNPKCNILHDNALRTAVKGVSLLKSAVEVDSIDAAICDCDEIWGTSDHPISGINNDLCEFQDDWLNHISRIGLLLGRESSGLTNDEVKWCRRIISIDSGNNRNVLNVSHALSIVLWVIKTTNIAVDKSEIESGHTSIEEKQDMVFRYEKVLENMKRSENVIRNKTGILSKVLTNYSEPGLIHLLQDLLGLLENRLKR